MSLEAPHGTYWVEPGRLLAGPHPGRIGLDVLLDGPGIDVFVDLTEEARYAHLLDEAGLDDAYRHHPVEDFDVPSDEEMGAILGDIDAALAAGRVVYVHCRAGIGRTGTVVGCYLAGRPGAGTRNALGEVARLRSAAGLMGRAPETPEQRAFVQAWASRAATEARS